MEISTVETNSVEDFMSGLVSKENTDDPNKAAATVIEKPFEEVKVKTEKEETDDAVQKALLEKKTEDTTFDFRTVSEKLIAEGILSGFEDGKVESEEDLKILLEGNIEQKARVALEERWEQKISNYSPDIQLILKYADGGISDTRDLQKLMSQMSARNEISELDPKNEEDQERIVMIQLINSGLNEKAARATVEDLKTAKSLSTRANEFYPGLKNSYDLQVKQTLLEGQQEERQRNQYVKDNSVNVQFLLNNEVDYLPFKIQESQYKSAVYQLAAKPTRVSQDGEIVFAWQDYIKSLQEGDEKQYKEFLKIITFAASSKKYDEAISKVSSSNTSKENFKKIKILEGKGSETQSQEKSATGIRKNQGSPWTV